jgi:hypothetical protein
LLRVATAILLACTAAMLQACGDGGRRSAPMKFAVVLEDVVQVPASSDSPPRARINFLFHAGDGSIVSSSMT